MKKVIKIISVVLSLILTTSAGVSVFAVSPRISNESPAEQALTTLEESYANDITDLAKLETVKEFINIYKNDPLFSEDFLQSPEDALDMVKDVINGALVSLYRIQPAWTDGQIYSADGVPTHSQIQNNSCGAASALQVIVFRGGGSSIAGSTMNTKEATLISETNLNLNGSIYVYEVRNLINEYTIPNDYVYIECTNMSNSTFRTLVLNSLAQDRAIILHAIPKYLTSYYPSTATTGHYIVGTTYFAALDQFSLNDCHYNPSYNGIHTVAMTEAYNSIHSQSGRYLIYKP